MGSLSKSQTWADSSSRLYTSISFRFNSVDELMRVPRLPPFLCPHKSILSRYLLGFWGGLGRPVRCSESRTGEGGPEHEMTVGTPENPAGMQTPACQSCSTTVARTLLSPNGQAHPPPARPWVPGLSTRVGLRGRRIHSDLPSRRWAAGGEARTSTQPASSRVSNFLGGAFAESLFLQKHRST